MIEIERLIDQVRALLAGCDDNAASHEIKVTEAWEEAAAEMARRCHDANERLRRCRDYLQRGMRSEAVHAAACRPDLLDLTGALQFPEMPAWTKQCARHGLPVPPRLATDVVAALRDARHRERAIEPLLALHRALAMARSPLRDRLELLRLLAERDPGSPCWREDVRLLEAARLREMRLEAKAGFRARDAAALERLWAELTAREWIADVSDDLRVGLQRAVDSLRAEQATAELDAILTELSRACEAGDLAAAQALVVQWQELIQSRKINLPRPFRRRIREVVAWIEAAEAPADPQEPAQSQPHEPDAPTRRWRLWGRTLVLLLPLFVAAAALSGFNINGVN